LEAPPYARRYLSRSPPMVAKPTQAIRSFYDEHALRNTGSCGYSEARPPTDLKEGPGWRTDGPPCVPAREKYNAGGIWHCVGRKVAAGRIISGVAIRPKGSTATVPNNHLHYRDLVALPVAQYRLAFMHRESFAPVREVKAKPADKAPAPQVS
jgi:hypothetical protein